jgi:hypothetical protein
MLLMTAILTQSAGVGQISSDLAARKLFLSANEAGLGLHQ